MVLSKQARIVGMAVLAVVGLATAAPVASALAWGVDGTSVAGLKAAGTTPQMGQTWVGAWMKTYGWSGFENDLRSMSANGVTPVVLWYYWGDAVTPNCVSYGCNGLSRGEWDSMARDMATRANAIMGGKAWYVVLEPEFNKNGVSSMEAFDGYLAAQAGAIHSIAPSAKVVVGFGSWGGWDIFDRAVGASDLVGFQLLYGSTRTSSATAIASGDTMLSVGSTLKSRWGKPILIFDFDVATYGGWESVQQQAIAGVTAKSGQLATIGVQGVVWRYVKDNTLSSGYFGAAESTWGVAYGNGAHKPGYDTLMSAIRGGGAITTTFAAPAAPGPAPTSAGFSSVKGNDWWIEATVAGSPTSVTAVLSPGGTYAMSKTAWGSWAVSAHAPSSTLVTLTARYGDGSSVTAAYAWPSATLVTNPPSATAAAGTATFSGVTGNTWWVQVSVGGPQTIASVSARVNGGAWVPLVKQSWGGWAKSFYVAPGSGVQFQATSTAGAVTTSGIFPW